MINIEELDRIIAFAIPICNTDCKRVVSKKEWRREETKSQLMKLTNLPGINNELVIPSSPNIIKENSDKINKK